MLLSDLKAFNVHHIESNKSAIGSKFWHTKAAVADAAES
jgi:hypothetical protein